MSKLNQIINDAETERMKQQKELDIVASERDILGTQVIIIIIIVIIIIILIIVVVVVIIVTILIILILILTVMI